MSILKNFLSYNPPKENNNFSLPEPAYENEENITYENQQPMQKSLKNQEIFTNTDVNIEFMKSKYNALINKDIIMRKFTLTAQDKTYSAFIMYIDGMTNTENINEFVLKPLMLRNRANTYSEDKKIAVTTNISVKRKNKFNLEEYIYNSLMPQNAVTRVKTFSEISESINIGNTALFIDTLNVAFDIELKGFEKRSISSPQNEVVIRGPQEAFVESLRTNTSMLRRIINNENFIIEQLKIGKITKKTVAICYMKNITNESLISEVKYRLNNLDLDSVTTSGQLEQLIEDSPNTLFPQILATERPDKVANHILEGRVGILLNGAPYVLIVPAILIDFISSPEDINLKFQYANLLKILRSIAYLITLLLPGLYIAITSYHEELLPTELLFAIASSRETVPFPLIFEIIIMEISFELIREAILRVPSPIGPTIGIVGALILGEAAVSANLVSPILIIIVAITAICSFVVPNYELSFSLRIYRFVYVILGFLGGFVGIGLVVFVQGVVLSNLRSFGVAYLAPYLPITNIIKNKTFLQKPLWKTEKRPDFLNAKRKFSESETAMKWKKI